MESFGWATLYPEILLLVAACIILLVDLRVTDTRRTLTYALTLLAIGAASVIAGMQALSGQTAYGFSNMVVNDPMGNWLKCFAGIAMMITLVYGRPYAADREMTRGGELFTLGMFSLLGMFVMISGNNFLVVYLGLELLTLSSYALVALRRDHGQSTEAAMKYFVLGAMASGFLLYGLSMLYGATGSLDLAKSSRLFRPDKFGIKCLFSALYSSLQVLHSSWALLLSICGFPMYIKEHRLQLL